MFGDDGPIVDAPGQLLQPARQRPNGVLQRGGIDGAHVHQVRDRVRLEKLDDLCERAR